MNEDAKKTALRMIPYGMFILTAKAKEGQDISAATVNWVTQTSFTPPLIAVGVKADSGAHGHIKDTGNFAINVLEKTRSTPPLPFSNPTNGKATPSPARLSRTARKPAARCSSTLLPGGSARWWARSPKAITRCSWEKSWRRVSAPKTRPS